MHVEYYFRYDLRFYYSHVPRAFVLIPRFCFIKGSQVPQLCVYLNNNLFIILIIVLYRRDLDL